MTSEIRSMNVGLKLIIQKKLVRVLQKHQRHLASQLPPQREILVYPKPQEKKAVSRRKPAVNKAAVCITNNHVLDKLKEEEKEKVEAEKKRTAKKQERERKRVEKEKKKEEIAERKKEREEKKQKSSVRSERGKRSGRGKRTVHAEFAAMKLHSTSSSETESDATCPKCGLVYS